MFCLFFFFFQAEDGIRDHCVTVVQTCALPISLPLPAALAAQTGQFLVRLGRDTLAVERYTRTADRLEGEQVVRSPRTVHQIGRASCRERGEERGAGGAVKTESDESAEKNEYLE